MPIESLEQSGATQDQVIQWDDAEGMWMAKTISLMVDGGFPSDTYNNIQTIDGGTP